MITVTGQQNVIREIRKPGRVFVNLCESLTLPVEVKKTSLLRLLHRLTNTEFGDDEPIAYRAYRAENGNLFVSITGTY